MDRYMIVKHSGVKGMKWGVRRYQNVDGSLTELGRQHYGVGQARKTAGIDPHRRNGAIPEVQNVLNSSATLISQLNDAAKKTKRDKYTIDSLKKDKRLQRKLNRMTNEELDELFEHAQKVNRTQREIQGGDYSAAKQMTSNSLDKIRTILVLVSTGLSVYSAVRTMLKGRRSAGSTRPSATLGSTISHSQEPKKPESPPKAPEAKKEKKKKKSIVTPPPTPRLLLPAS